MKKPRKADKIKQLAKNFAKNHEGKGEFAEFAFEEGVKAVRTKEYYEAISKAEKWDKLGDKIEEVYNDDSGGGDLVIIGELAATAYGWL